MGFRWFSGSELVHKRGLVEDLGENGKRRWGGVCGGGGVSVTRGGWKRAMNSFLIAYCPAWGQ